MYSLDVNFLKDRGLNTTVETQKQTTKKSSPIQEKIPMAVGGVLAVLLPFLALSGAKNYEAKEADAQDQIKQIDLEIAKRQNENKSLEEIESQISREKTETKALVGVFDRIRPWSAILQEVGERTPPGVQVSSLSQNGSGSSSKLQISGSARSYNDVNDFVLFLQRSSFFSKKGIILGNLSSTSLPIEVANEDVIPEQTSLKIPGGIKYSITAQLNNVPTSKLIKELDRKGSIGVVTRLKTLEQKGAIKR